MYNQEAVRTKSKTYVADQCGRQRKVRTSPEAKASKRPRNINVLVAKSVHAIDLGSIGELHAGSSPVQDTTIETRLRFLERVSEAFSLSPIWWSMNPNFKPYRTGMMTVLERYPCGKGNGKSKGRMFVYYLCKCDCGKEFIVGGVNYPSILIPADVLRNRKKEKQGERMTGL